MIGVLTSSATAIVPSPQLWVASLALLALGVWSLMYVLRMWRDAELVDRIQRYIGFVVGEAISASVAALAPLGAIYLLLAGGMLVVSLAAESGTGMLREALAGASAVLAILVVLAMLLTLSIVLVGRPVSAIPPRLRGHGGLLGTAFGWLRRDRGS